jgi:hypothetical protein
MREWRFSSVVGEDGPGLRMLPHHTLPHISQKLKWPVGWIGTGSEKSEGGLDLAKDIVLACFSTGPPVDPIRTDPPDDTTILHPPCPPKAPHL